MTKGGVSFPSSRVAKYKIRTCDLAGRVADDVQPSLRGAVSDEAIQKTGIRAFRITGFWIATGGLHRPRDDGERALRAAR
jgi:hypothetical protein